MMSALARRSLCECRRASWPARPRGTLARDGCHQGPCGVTRPAVPTSSARSPPRSPRCSPLHTTGMRCSRQRSEAAGTERWERGNLPPRLPATILRSDQLLVGARSTCQDARHQRTGNGVQTLYLSERRGSSAKTPFSARRRPPACRHLSCR